MVDVPRTSPPNGVSAAQPGAWVDPYRAYNFKLEIKNVTEAHFTACSALEVSVHSIRYRPGGMGPVVHQIPGPVEYAPVTLYYGLTESRDLWQWFMSSVAGQVRREDVSIILLDTNHVDELVRWNLYQAWPAKWVGAALDGSARQIAIASVTLVFEGLDSE